MRLTTLTRTPSAQALKAAQDLLNFYQSRVSLELQSLESKSSLSKDSMAPSFTDPLHHPSSTLLKSLRLELDYSNPQKHAEFTQGKGIALKVTIREFTRTCICTDALETMENTRCTKNVANRFGTQDCGRCVS